MGEVRLRQGQLGAAEKELKKAIELNDKYARAWYELARVFKPASLHHSAEIYLIRAQELAPTNRNYEEALNRVRWPRQHPEERRLISEYAHTSIPMNALMIDPRRMRGWSLSVSINGSKPLSLMLDTGAGGILLTSKAAERVGLQKTTGSQISGDWR